MNNAEAVVEKLIRRQEAEDTTVVDDLVADEFPDFLTAMRRRPDRTRPVATGPRGRDVRR